MAANDKKGKFALGRLVATPNALGSLTQEVILASLARHVRGDWGDVDEEDRRSNDRDLEVGGRLLSVYHDENGLKFWIITEADRSSTTVLMPEDY